VQRVHARGDDGHARAGQVQRVGAHGAHGARRRARQHVLTHAPEVGRGHPRGGRGRRCGRCVCVLMAPVVTRGEMRAVNEMFD
jgi:hypothetical protein